MDPQQFISFFKDLGLPAAISAVLTVLVKTVSDARQRNSKEALLLWLSQDSVVGPFEADDKALQALHELRQSLIFERAFGLKVDSKLRNELFLFAEAQSQSVRLQEVLETGRLVSMYSLKGLRNPKHLKVIRLYSRISKPFSYIYIGLGYILVIGGMYLPAALDWSGRLSLVSVIVGLVFGGLAIALGNYLSKLVRRFEIFSDFLVWRSTQRHPAESSHDD